MKQISESKPPRILLMAGVCLSIALGASQLPDSVVGSIRSTLLDSILPLQMLQESANEKWIAWKDSLAASRDSETAQLRRELAAWQRLDRLKKIEQAELKEQLQRVQTMGTSPYTVANSPSLFVPELIRAEVLGPREIELFEQSLLIERTSRDVFERGSLVLDDAPEIVIDQGVAAGLTTEHPVYSGRCVVGRLVDVGRWVSRVQLTTDKDYRGRAQILRPVDGGFNYGPEGIFEGTGGETCRLRYVGRTESVRVGDEVYTSARSAALPEPMFYGTIVKAELDGTAREWAIEIEPAVKPELLRTVEILKQSLNPVRVMGN